MSRLFFALTGWATGWCGLSGFPFKVYHSMFIGCFFAVGLVDCVWYLRDICFDLEHTTIKKNTFMRLLRDNDQDAMSHHRAEGLYLLPTSDDEILTKQHCQHAYKIPAVKSWNSLNSSRLEVHGLKFQEMRWMCKATLVFFTYPFFKKYLRLLLLFESLKGRQLNALIRFVWIWPFLDI